MTQRTYYILLISVIAVCLTLSAAHLVYAFYAYNHASIIFFIGKELW